MPRRLLLDGDDLLALMQRVRTELGPDAVVVKAERVRSGGVAGFFANERFELTVDVPDGRPATAEPVVTDAAPVGLSALLEAADAADGGDGGDGRSRSRRSVRADGAPSVTLPGPRVSTDGDTFARLLASIDGMTFDGMTDVGPASPIAAWAASAVADGGSPATSSAADGEADAGARPAHPAARFAPPGATVTAAAFAPLGDAGTATSPETDAAAPSAAPASPPTPDTPVPAEPHGPVSPDPARDPSATAGSGAVVTDPVPTSGSHPTIETGVRVTEPAAPEPAPATPETPPAAHPASDPLSAPPPARPVPLAPEGAPAASGGADRRALLDLGLPRSVVGHGPLDEPLPLSRLLAGMPRPPAPLRAPGAVVAVVGEESAAFAVAGQLAQRAYVDPRDVALVRAVAPYARGDRLRRAGGPRHRAEATTPEEVRIVAVGVGPRPEDRAAAAAVLAELDPHQCWAVVDARLKTSDLRSWLREVAGECPVDAVAAEWVHATREPGTVLELGVPVGWLDGLPASPVVWAAVISERLGADARWD